MEIPCSLRMNSTKRCHAFSMTDCRRKVRHLMVKQTHMTTCVVQNAEVVKKLSPLTTQSTNGIPTDAAFTPRKTPVFPDAFLFCCVVGYDFKTRYNFNVSVGKDGGKWWATLGDVSDERVPVFCSDATDIETELRILHQGPPSLAFSRLNVMNHNRRRVVYLGPLGLRGGGNSSSKTERRLGPKKESIKSHNLLDLSLAASNSFEDDDAIEMRFFQLMTSSSITNTAQLIDALKSLTDNDNKEALFGWTLHAYHSELKNIQSTDQSLNQLMEFACLNELHVTDMGLRRMLRDEWLQKLIKEAKRIDDPSMMMKWSDLLMHLDTEIFERQWEWLMTLTDICIKKLVRYHHSLNEMDQCFIGSALYRMLAVIHAMHPDDWQKFKATVDVLLKNIDAIVKMSMECYPALHCAKLIQQGLIQLKSERGQICANASNASCEVPKTLMYVVDNPQSWPSYPSFSMDVDTIIGPSSTEGPDDRPLVEKWFIWLQSLNQLTMVAMQNESAVEAYLQYLDGVMHEAAFLSIDDQKHLRYGILKQLTMLMTTRSDQVTASKTAMHFIQHGTPNDESDDVSSDRDIQECLKEAQRLKKFASNAQNEIQATLSQDQPCARTLLDLNGTYVSSMSLFIKVKCQVIQRHHQGSTDDIVTKLKSGYAQFEYHNDTRVLQGLELSQLKFNLNRIHDVNKVLDPSKYVKVEHHNGREMVVSDGKTKIDIDDFMSTDAHTHRVLVMGLSGAGKSTLGRRLAMDWSYGKWGSQFTTVFLLPFSDLLKAECMHSEGCCAPSLSKAIEKSCFSHIDTNEFNPEDLAKFVRRELRKPTTLLILDGPDEYTRDPSNYCESIMKQATLGQQAYQLLMLTRPNNGFMTLDRTEVYELSNLTDEDIRPHLPNDDPMAMDPQLKELARNPFNMHILCKELQPTNDDHPSTPRSLTYHVRKVVMERWHYYQDNSQSEEEMLKAFDALGRLALVGLNEGRCRVLLSELNGDVHLNARSNIFRSGLLIHNARGDFEFTHSVFLQYFAGRLLAHMLMDGDRKAEAEFVIQKMKYAATFGNVMAAVVRELAFTQKQDGIRKLMRLIDGGDVEHLGLQHLGIKMHCLQQWLLEVNAKDYDLIDVEFSDVKRQLVHWISKSLKSKQRRDKRKGKRRDDIMKAVLQLLKTYPYLVAHSRLTTSRHVMEAFLRQLDNDMAVEMFACIIGDGEKDRDSWTKLLDSGLKDAVEQKQEATARCIGKLGGYQVKLIPELLELLKANSNPGKVYDRTVIELFRHAPASAIENIECLVEICESKDYWVRRATTEAIPEIVQKDNSFATALMHRLLEINKENPTVSAGVIDALGICVELHSGYVDDLVKDLLNGWKFMGEDQRHAAAKAFNRVIHCAPGKAVEIVTTLLEDDAEAPWPSVYPIVKTVLEAIGSIRQEEADEVVKLLKEKYEKKEDNHSLALVLVAIEHVVETSDSSLPELIKIILKAFEDKDWSIRNLTYRAAGAIAKHRRSGLSELIPAVTKCCENETIWKAQCGVFEAASQFLEANADLQDLFTVCSDALGNSDDIIRELAGNAVMKAEIERFRRDDSVINHLVDRLQSANEETEHGIIHCLNLIAQNIPDAIPMIQPVFAEATSSQSSIVASAAVSGLLTVASSEKTNIEELIDPLIKACESKTRGIRFCALEALTICIGESKHHLENLIASLEHIPVPLNDREWTVYFKALKIAVREPQEDASKLLEILLKDNIEDHSYVRKQRRTIINDISLDLLLEWYGKTKSTLVVQTIFHRFYGMPIVFKKKESQANRMMCVYDEGQESQLSIDQKLLKKLGKVGGSKKTWLKRTISATFHRFLV